MRPARIALLALGVTLAPGVRDVGADTFKLTEPDGTRHFTNAPTDPRYRRMGLTTGTEAGFLRLPNGDTGPYLQEIRDASERYGVPIKLVSAVIRAESGFNPRAVSRKGAQGLMQLMPGTASMLGVRNSFDPRENIDGGVRHLRSLMDRFPDNLPMVLAAYNAGERAVVQHRGIPPYPETIGYVQKVLHFFNGGTAATVALTPVVYPTRRWVAEDGTIVYSNLPPAEAARLVRR